MPAGLQLATMIRGAATLIGLWIAGGAGGPSTPRVDGLPIPLVVTERVRHDSDDPAIWVNSADPARSLVLGTDKHEDGSLYAFDLAGRVVKRVPGLERPNNVDVEYGLALGGQLVDIAVVTERRGDSLRIFRLPELVPIDGGPIPVFCGEAQRGPMGVGLYKRPSDAAVFAILSRKSGPARDYLWQYRLEDGGSGVVKAAKVRAFGAFSGRGGIEAVAVDDALGFVYYADERVGVRKYRADPEDPDAGRELALFATDRFARDREGISIYTMNDGMGYILVSDQQVGRFHVYPREGVLGDPHSHPCLKSVKTSAVGSDGSEVTNAALGAVFPAGLFVAMSDDGTFHFYAWPQIAGSDLSVAPDGVRPGPR